MRLAPHLAHLHDLLTLPSTGGRMRGELLAVSHMDLRAGRLAQHSMHLVD